MLIVLIAGATANAMAPAMLWAQIAQARNKTQAPAAEIPVDKAKVPPAIRTPTAEEQAQIAGWMRQALAADRARDWDEAARLIQQIMAIEEQTYGPRHPEIAGSLSNLASTYQARALYAQAEPLYRKALDIRQAALGERHPDTATSYNSVAANLDDQGRYAAAEPLYRKALEIRQAVLGEQHPDTATSYNNLASDLDSQGRYTEAEPLYRKALDIRQAALGERHPDTATSYNNVAYNLNALGRYTEAEPLYRKALEIRQAVLGERHPDTATSYNNLASNLDSQSRYTEAEPLVRKALEIRQAVLGERHPATAGSYNNVAYNLNAQGRYAEAEPLVREAVKIYQAVLGERHPATANGYNSVAANLNDQGRYAEAEPLFRRALEIRQAVRGERHPDTATSYNNVAANLNAQGRYAAAEPLYRKALDIRQAALGERHPDTATSYNSVAANLNAQGRYAAAEPLYRKALDIRQAALGERHPDTATSYNSVASNLDDQGRYAAAEPLYRKALEIRQAAVGERHPDTAGSYNNVAYNLNAQGRYAEAEPLYRKALEIRQVVLGERHPDTAGSYNNVAYNLNAQGRYAEAEPLFRRALEISQAVLGERHPDTATSYNNVAANLNAQGRYAAAEPLFHKALEIRRIVLGERHPATADSYDTVTSSLDARGRYVEAEPLYRKALEIRQAVLGERHPDTAVSYNNVAANLNAQGRYAEAEPLFHKALEIRQAVFGERHPDTAVSYNNVAHTLGDQSRYAAAESMASKAVEIRRSIRARESSSNKSGSGAPSAPAGKTNSFHTYLHVSWSLGRAEAPKLPQLRSAAFTVAQDLEASSAGQALAQAAARVAAGQAGLSDVVRKRQDLAVQARGYDARLLQALGAGDQPTAQAMRAELERSSQELSGLDDEIRTKFPRYAELVSPQALEVAEVQERLKPGEGVLLIAPSGRDVHVFAVSKTKVVWNRVEGGAKGVAEAVSVLRCQADPVTCQQGGSATRGAASAYGTALSQGAKPFDRAKAYGLHRDLIAPVEDALEGVATLYVTASGPLSGLPLGLLLTQAPRGGDDADPQALAASPWLADRYALVTLPSVSSLRALGALKTAPGRLALAGYGDPVLDGKPGGARSANLSLFRSVSPDGHPLADLAALRSTLAPLPGTRVELEAMAAALNMPRASLRLGSAATEASVKTSAELSQAQVVVFATHGLLPHELKGLEEPGLVFTPPTTATADDDGVLTASEAARLNLSADWVILSACNTASADGTPGGESLSGLAKAFLYAGAHALMASHWRVQDDVTAALTVQTISLQRSNPGLSKAQALQAAMKAVRTGTLPDGSPLPGWTPAWSHPAAWAPFSLITAGR